MEFLALWLKSQATNTVPAVVTSPGTGQAAAVACLTKDKPCPDYFKLACCGFLELPRNKIVCKDSWVSKPGPWNQTSDEDDASYPKATTGIKSCLPVFLSFTGDRKHFFCCCCCLNMEH
jgi:hypothetical protein